MGIAKGPREEALGKKAQGVSGTKGQFRMIQGRSKDDPKMIQDRFKVESLRALSPALTWERATRGR